MGPGTPVVAKILANVQPRSHNDYVALQHDIDYLSSNEPIISDINAMLRGNNDLDGIALKLGLGARVVADILLGPYHKLSHFNDPNQGDQSEKRAQLELISGSKLWNPFYWK